VFTLYFVNQWQTWVIILAIVLLLFGATRLPALSKSLGQSVKSFRKEMQSDDAAPTDSAKADSAKAESATVEPTKPAADKE
jgi:sec-independent protein translocase protein TatA